MKDYNILIEEDAKLDIAKAFDWYSRISEKVCDHFLFQINNTLQYLKNDPYIFRKIFKDFRQVPVRKFPFLIVYIIEDKQVKIYRVFPSKMNPSKKFE